MVWTSDFDIQNNCYKKKKKVNIKPIISYLNNPCVIERRLTSISKNKFKDRNSAA